MVRYIERHVKLVSIEYLRYIYNTGIHCIFASGLHLPLSQMSIEVKLGWRGRREGGGGGGGRRGKQGKRRKIGVAI